MQWCYEVWWHLTTRTCSKFVHRVWNSAIQRTHFSSASWQIPSRPVFPWSTLEDPFPCLGRWVMSCGILSWVDAAKNCWAHTHKCFVSHKYAATLSVDIAGFFTNQRKSPGESVRTWMWSETPWQHATNRRHLLGDDNNAMEQSTICTGAAWSWPLALPKGRKWCAWIFRLCKVNFLRVRTPQMFWWPHLHYW